MRKIGKFSEVDIRDIWKHEQYDFSDWLAKDENIEELNRILGLTLVDITKEAYVGSYRCDIFAKDETTGIKVIIENQLEPTNHDHLGKIITYASGLGAKVIVWIVRQAKEEHRSAIEWLNNNTGNDINFFLIEIHAYQIDDSLPAPMFEVIEKPNGFIKSNKTNGSDGELNKSQSERLEFWNQFNEVLISKGKPFNVRKATTDHWYDVALGKSAIHISITLVDKNSYIGVEYYINSDKELYDEMYSKKDEFEKEVGFEFDWQRLESKKASRIISKFDGLNFDNHDNYPKLMDEAIRRAVLMRDAFKKLMK